MEVVLDVAAHAAALSLAVGIICTATPSSALFPWHPTFMVISFLFLMTEAILLFSRHASPLRSASRKTKSTVHWIVQTCTGVTFLLGLAAIVTNKYLRGKPHLMSWHSWFGVGACVMATIQSCCGAFLFYPNLMPRFTLKQLKMMHAASGALTYSLGCSTVVLACYSNWFVSQDFSLVVWSLFAGGPIFLVAVVARQVYTSHFERMWKC